MGPQIIFDEKDFGGRVFLPGFMRACPDEGQG